MLFDTTFFIDLSGELKAKAEGRCHVFLRQHRHVAKRVSVITLGEFAVGTETRYLLRFFRGWQPVALGAATAIEAGRLQAALSFELGENDLWIAATALRFGLPLVTADRAFSRVPGLRVMSY